MSIIFVVNIEMTSKNSVKDEDYTMFDNEETKHDTIVDALNYITDRYKGKRVKTYVYQDKKDGGKIRIGWIYGYWNSDTSDVSISKWLQEDWITINKVTTESIEI